MLSPSQDVPAYRVSATARELERIRAKRRLLETVAKGAPTSAQTVLTETQQQSPSVPKLDVDPGNRNSKIKANARKLLDRLQAADTSLADSAHNLKLMFAKQALRALAERQAAVAAEAQQRKLDKLRERLTEEHRRQQQHQQQQHAIEAQVAVQPQTLPQTQVPVRTLRAQSPVHVHSPDAARQYSPTRLERTRSPSSHHQSRSRRNGRGRSPSRRSPSPQTEQQRQQRIGAEFDSISGYSCDSDAQRSDAMHVRDTRRSSSPSRDRSMYVSRLNANYQREPRPAGPTEAGLQGAVSAQALSALLAGLQSHGVNLTSGPPPLPPAVASSQNNQTGGKGEAAKGAAGASMRSGSSGGTGFLPKGGESGAEEQPQYVLLPDGTVGLVHTIVKPAVLQPQVTPAGAVPPAAPHAVPLVLLQPGSPGAVGSGAPAAVAPASMAPWPPPPPHTYPYGSLTAPVGPPPPPFYPSPPLGMYSAQAQYPYLHALYSLYGSIPPASYPFQAPASTPAGAAPQVPPQFISPYLGADSIYYRPPQYQQQQQQQLANQGGTTATPPAVRTVAHIDESQAQRYVHYQSDSPRIAQGRGGPGQSQVTAAPQQQQLVRDADNNVRHSMSSLSSDPYGNLAGSVLIGTEDGAVGGGGAIAVGSRLISGGGSGSDLRSQASSPQAAMALGSPNPPPSTSGMPSPGNTEPSPGNGPGGSGVQSGSRYHHRRSHSGAESLRSLPSNSGGSGRGGPGSLSMSHHYEPTLASPSLRGSQDLDSPASFRDMPRRTSGSISLSPLRGVTGTGGGSIDSGPHFGGDAPRRRHPSPLFVSSVAAPGSPDPSMPPGVPSGSSGSSSGGSVVLRVTAAGSVPAQVSQGGSGFPGGGEPSGIGSAAVIGGADEPSLLLRTLDLGSASMQRSKPSLQMSDELVETPTSRKPSLTSPWSSSGPSEVAISASGGVSPGGPTASGVGGSGGASVAMFSSTRDLLSDVVSRPPLYGTSLPYGTAGLYDRYTAGGFYGATGNLYSPSPLYGAPPTGGGGSFGGFDIAGGGNGSLLDRGVSGGSGGAATGVAAPRSPSSESLRSNGNSVKGYPGRTSPGATQGGLTGPLTGTSDLTGTSTALALTAAILEGSHASAAANAIITGSTVGLSAASVYGLSQMGLSHLHPSAAAISAMQPAAGATGPGTGPGSVAAPVVGSSSIGRSPSMNRRAQDSESSGGVGSGGASSIAAGQLSMPAGSPTNGSALTRLSHGSNLESMFSPRTRSRVQLMGNDDLTDAFSPRSPNILASNGQPTLPNGQQPQLVSTGSMRLTAATLNAQQQQLLMQGHYSSPQHSPSRLGNSRYPASGASGGSGSAVTLPTGATDIGGLQPTVPTLQLPPRAIPRMLGSAMGVAAAAMPAALPLPPTAGAASAPSSETTSPTRTENQGLSDLRDIDAEQSLSARSGRSALSEGHAGGITTALSTSSMERLSGVPVVENRGSGPDAASYAGLLGAQPYDVMAEIGGGGGAYSSVGFVAGGAPMSIAHPPLQPLPPLLEILSNSPFAAVASPSGSTRLSPLGLGFGGGSSTPLERSADSFVRIGSMPISGAASPMATANPIEVLGSPTKVPTGQVTTMGTPGSSGGTSSAGGGGSTAGGNSSQGAVSTAISAALPQLPQSVAPAPAILQQVAAATPSSNLQPQAIPAGIIPAANDAQPQPQLAQQQLLSGMSFRMGNNGAKGSGVSMGPGSYVNNAPNNAVVAATTTTTAAAAAAISTGGSMMARTSSAHGMASAASLQPAVGPVGILSPSGSRNNARASAAAALSTTALPPSSSSTVQRAVSKSFASPSGARTGATAIVNRVLAGRGEFDSDDDDDGDDESSGVAGGGDGVSSFSVSLRGAPGSSLQRGGSIGTSAGMGTAQRPGGAALSPGRGTLTGGSTVHDDEFNF